MITTLRRLSQHSLFFPVVLFLICFSVFFGFATLKFFRFQYDLLDLAIFDQVLSTTLQGSWFRFAIHGQHYFGDHFSPILFLVLPLYAAIPHPLTLLALHIAHLCASVFPIHAIVKHWLPKRMVPLFTAALFVHPILLSILLFEVEPLAWALPFILAAWWASEKKQPLWFSAFVILSLLMREDVALFWIFFAVLLAWKRQSWQWWLPLFLISVSWFIGSIKIISFFNPDQSYKFFIYYQTLGSNPIEILRNILIEPQRFVLQILRLTNIAYLVSAFILFLGLPLFSLSTLLPAVPLLFQLFLASFGGNEIALYSHYSTLLLPPMMVASILGFRRMLNTTQVTKSTLGRLQRLRVDYPGLLPLLALAVLLYSLGTVSPLPTMARQFFVNPENQRSDAQSLVLLDLPKTGPIIASTGLLSHLSARIDTLSLNYAFTGTRQFSSQPFPFPQNLSGAVVDTRDLLSLQLRSASNNPNTPEVLAERGQRLEQLLTSRGLEPKWILDEFVLFTTDGLLKKIVKQKSAATYSNIPSIDLNDNVRRYKLPQIELHPIMLSFKNDYIVEFDLALEPKTPLPSAAIQWIWTNPQTRQTQTRLMPVAYGLYPTSAWKLGEVVTTHYRLLVPRSLLRQLENTKPSITLEGQLVAIKGMTSLDKIRSSQLRITSSVALTDPFRIGTMTWSPSP